jgi:hypothetical protein
MTLTIHTATGKKIPVGSICEVRRYAIHPVVVTCSACAIAVINGHVCHELGCPEAWKDETRQCRWCGSEFSPRSKGQGFCENSCWAAYNGYETDEDRQTADDDTASNHGDDDEQV